MLINIGNWFLDGIKGLAILLRWYLYFVLVLCAIGVVSAIWATLAHAQLQAPANPTYDTPYGLSGGPKSQGIKIPSC